ncbi:hypothetical protein D3C73_1469820 [compost metagenome]
MLILSVCLFIIHCVAHAVQDCTFFQLFDDVLSIIQNFIVGQLRQLVQQRFEDQAIHCPRSKTVGSSSTFAEVELFEKRFDVFNNGKFLLFATEWNSIKLFRVNN